MDLIGFGLIIPLISLYGKKFGAGALELGLLGASYSLMQFFFAPVWGRLSDKVGRRPILLMSLAGSTLSYLGFAYAGNFWWLVATRCFAGAFAANISTAQAFVADVTTPENRAKGMGMIGAAFGLGFILGPGLAYLTLHFYPGMLQGPGLLAALICGLNLALAYFRLPESLTPAIRAKAAQSPRKNGFKAVAAALTHPRLGPLYAMFFLLTFCMANMEQTFSVFFEQKFQFGTAGSGEATGKILVWAGILGAFVQGFLVRRLVKKWGEYRLVLLGLVILAPGALSLGYGSSYQAYFLLVIPMAFGSGFVTPSLSAMISRSATAAEQGATLGMSQSLGSLARAVGPFLALWVFHINPSLPFVIAGLSALLVLLIALTKGSQYKRF